MKTKDPYAVSRVNYIIEAALEYFISILVAESYLAKVATSIGLSDTLTGILTSFVSLGCAFQLLSLLLAGKRRVKRWVILLHSVNQLAFALVYVAPIFPVGSHWKTVAFIAFLLIGHILNQVVNSPKINMFMALVDDSKRGRFTANKEIISLISGMIFTLVMGNIIDRCEAAGNLNRAFTLIALTIFTLMLLHTATIVFSKEKEIDRRSVSPKEMLQNILRDPSLFRIILVAVIWNMISQGTTSFYGTFKNNDLGFSMTFNAVLSIAYSIVRALVSRPMGRYADKTSFARMMTLCFCFQATALLVNTFTNPSNGKVMYTIYYMLHAVAQAGINSGLINLVYDYVSLEMRTATLAVQGTVSGVAGFLTALAASIPVSRIQSAGNTFLGMHVYAQQVLSAVGCAATLLLVLYLNRVVAKLPHVRKNSAPEKQD